MVWLKSCLAAFAALLASPAWAEDLLVFAAASLKGPLDAIIADQPGVTVSYGSSGALARQVLQGAPADVVLLANREWMDALTAAEAVGAPVVFAGNRLILIGQPGTGPVALERDAILAALDDGRLAMGFTASVPAGIYGREALETLGLWEALEAHVAEVDNVRAALSLVARGEAPLGVVYRSDAQVVPELPIVATFPADSHAPIEYWGSVPAGGKDGAAAFLDRLIGHEAQDIFVAAGFCRAGEGCE